MYGAISEICHLRCRGRGPPSLSIQGDPDLCHDIHIKIRLGGRGGGVITDWHGPW